MVRLYFLVEGQTEQEFVNRVLTEHLARFEVYVAGAVLPITARKRGLAIGRGGGTSYLSAKNTLSNLMKANCGADVRFTTMFDLYGLYSDWPKLGELDHLRHLPEERVRRLEQAFADELGDSRLIPHLQLYEFETLLLCGPELLALYLTDPGTLARELERAVADAGGNPERVNDGPTTSPSRRIGQCWPESERAYDKQKTTIGADCAAEIGLPALRAKCPHFDAWITRLESLGTPLSIP